VSITLPRNGRFGTVAASNDVVLEMDHDQYDTGEGPCLDAAIQGERFHIDALSDEERWPAFVPRAQARGIKSILSTPLISADRPLGALNVYSRTVGAFAVHEKEWADQFASEAATVVSTARMDESVHGLSAQIRAALQSREVIALAQGMVMQRDGVGPPAAHATLVEISRATGRRLRDISDDLVRANTDDAAQAGVPTISAPSDGSAHGPAAQ
jgi:GAF domain-containing protein